MTDEEIEKAAEYCLGAESCFDCNKCQYDSRSNTIIVCHSLAKDLLNHITRLKTENEDMHGEIMSYKAYIDNHEEIWKHNAEMDKAIVRKDTAKEILFELKAKCPSMFEGLLSWIDTKLKHYGVEVDDE